MENFKLNEEEIREEMKGLIGISKELKSKKICLMSTCSKEFRKKYKVYAGTIAAGIQTYIEHLEKENEQLKTK